MNNSQNPTTRQRALERLRLIAADTGKFTGHSQLCPHEAAEIQAEIERMNKIIDDQCKVIGQSAPT